MFSWTDGFGHKHEGGACSIVFHCALPPGDTFFAPHQESNQVDPGGDGESYEYVDEKEVDLRENEEKGMDDGDRLVGGKISNTRFTLDIRRDKILSGCFLSWWAGTSTDSQTRCPAVVRFQDFCQITFLWILRFSYKTWESLSTLCML